MQQPSPYPTSVIVLDATVNPNAPITSDNFVNTVAQPSGTANFWYQNPANPLYMMCVGYKVNGGTNQLLSSPACSGSGSQCISYSIA